MQNELAWLKYARTKLVWNDNNTFTQFYSKFDSENLLYSGREVEIVSAKSWGWKGMMSGQGET